MLLTTSFMKKLKKTLGTGAGNRNGGCLTMLVAVLGDGWFTVSGWGSVTKAK